MRDNVTLSDTNNNKITVHKLKSLQLGMHLQWILIKSFCAMRSKREMCVAARRNFMVNKLATATLVKNEDHY